MKHITETDRILRELDERDLLKLAVRVALAHECTVEEMVGRQRRHAFAHARHTLWAILYARGHWSQLRLAELFRYDHTTICNGIHSVSRETVEAFEPARGAESQPSQAREPLRLVGGA